MSEANPSQADIRGAVDEEDVAVDGLDPDAAAPVGRLGRLFSTPTQTATTAPIATSSSSVPAPTPSPAAPASPPTMRHNIVVFSGGSAANNLVDVFEHVRSANKVKLSYIIPISDNGGSSSELIRVFGGPGIGDVRSRLVRLIPDNDDPETVAMKHLFNHRLPRGYAAAKEQWLELIEGLHPLWKDISPPKRELIRSHLNHFNFEAVKRIRPSSRFDFSGASIGNLFLTGARLFTGSFEASIYLLGSICAVPDHTSVLPALNTNFAHHIAAGLYDGTVIAGQNDISHPSVPTAASSVPDANIYDPSATQVVHHHHHQQQQHQFLPRRPCHDRHINEADDEVEDANLPGTLTALRKPALDVSKEGEEQLPARIQRLWYINPYGEEIRIPANARVLDAIRACGTVVYSIGSLFTSLVPSLVLRGVGEALATSSAIRHKILILNGTHDRESGPPSCPLTAADFVAVISRACADSRGTSTPLNEVDFAKYVTHVIHLDAPGSPAMNRTHFDRLGIKTIQLYGRPNPTGKGARYDQAALTQALEAVIGRKDVKPGDRRRYTFLG